MPVEGMLGRKLGMTQLFREDGLLYGVTAIQAGPCTVTQVRTPDRDGYGAVQLGFEEGRRLSQPQRGHLKTVGKLLRRLREVPAAEMEDVEVGQEVTVELFQAGELVDVISTSKGRGFTGVMKRHNFRGGPRTHGQSDRQRAPGSIGGTTTPGRVLKGLKMAGHSGTQRVTVQNLEVVKVDPERHLLFLKGAVPGASRGLVLIRKALKARG